MFSLQSEIMKVFRIFTLTMTLMQIICATNLPEGCRHFRRILVCEHLKEFPRSFVTTAKAVTIAHSKFPEIPSGAFSSLSKLTNLTMYLVTIKTIKSCAFSSLNLLFFNLMFSDIDTIESNAFINISGKQGGKMNFFMLNIGRIEPYAFNNVQGFNHFSMDLIRITTIQSYGFNNVQPYVEFTIRRANISDISAGAFQDIKSAVTIETCTINRIGCHTFDSLHNKLGQRFQLHSIAFNCHCDLAWFADVIRETRVGDDITCFEPSDLSRTNLSEVTQQQLCNGSVPDSCDPNGVATPMIDVCETNTASAYDAVFVFLVFSVICCIQ